MGDGELGDGEQGGRVKSSILRCCTELLKKMPEPSRFCPANRLEQPEAFSYSDFPKERGKTQPFWVNK